MDEVAPSQDLRKNLMDFARQGARVGPTGTHWKLVGTELVDLPLRRDDGRAERLAGWLQAQLAAAPDA